MTGRRIPEPGPGLTPEQRAADRELAIVARAAGDALQAAIDYARPLGYKPDGYRLDDLQRVADTLKGWALRMALGVDIDLVNRWTGRQFVELTGGSLTASLTRTCQPAAAAGEAREAGAHGGEVAADGA